MQSYVFLSSKLKSSSSSRKETQGVNFLLESTQLRIYIIRISLRYWLREHGIVQEARMIVFGRVVGGKTRDIICRVDAGVVGFAIGNDRIGDDGSVGVSDVVVERVEPGDVVSKFRQSTAIHDRKI